MEPVSRNSFCQWVYWFSQFTQAQRRSVIVQSILYSVKDFATERRWALLPWSWLIEKELTFKALSNQEIVYFDKLAITWDILCHILLANHDYYDMVLVQIYSGITVQKNIHIDTFITETKRAHFLSNDAVEESQLNSKLWALEFGARLLEYWL